MTPIGSVRTRAALLAILSLATTVGTQAEPAFTSVFPPPSSRHTGRRSWNASATASREARPGMQEYELQAAAEYVFKRHGAQGPAYLRRHSRVPRRRHLHGGVTDTLPIPSAHLGLRLEDVILVTGTGYENLSGHLPTDIASIERIMSEPGIEALRRDRDRSLSPSP